jgi:hypothetical protein
MKDTYQITLNKEQLCLVLNALDCLGRLKIGQFNLISENVKEGMIKVKGFDDTVNEQHQLDYFLQQAKAVAFRLQSNASFGVGKFKTADACFDMVDIINHHFHKESGSNIMSAYSRPPMHWNKEHELIKIEKVG